MLHCIWPSMIKVGAFILFAFIYNNANIDLRVT